MFFLIILIIGFVIDSVVLVRKILFSVLRGDFSYLCG